RGSGGGGGLARPASSAPCAVSPLPLVRAPASIATRSPTTNALVRCFGVSPPWQPMTRRSTFSRASLALELLGHLEKLHELEQARLIHDDDGPHLVLHGDAQPAQPGDDALHLPLVDADLAR